MATRLSLRPTVYPCDFSALAGASFFFHLIVTLLCSMNGALAFVDTSDCTMMNIAEHYMASDVEWDPTGRYVVTSVSWWSHKVEKLPLKAHLLFKQFTNVGKNNLFPRWTTHTGCGRSRAACFRRTTRIVSVSCCGDPDPQPCSAATRSR